jgi:hypothetical protein
MSYVCPVCGYANLPYAPEDYHICPCCSTEFGSDDAEFTHAQLREMWVAGGARWFFGNPPPYWNPWIQLINGGHQEVVPKFACVVTTSTNYTAEPARLARLTDGFVISLSVV